MPMFYPKESGFHCRRKMRTFRWDGRKARDNQAPYKLGDFNITYKERELSWKIDYLSLVH